MQEVPKITDRWQSPEVQNSVKVEGEQLEKLAEAFRTYDRKYEALRHRSEAIAAGVKAESESILEEVFAVLREVLKDTTLEGSDPHGLDVDTDYVEKFGFIMVRPQPPQQPAGINAILDALGLGRESDSIEIKKG